jgi:tetratricopeptide (TPR) repeat protein
MNRLQSVAILARELMPQFKVALGAIALGTTLGLGDVSSSGALTLNQQLDIPLNNGSRSDRREQADQLVQLGIEQQRAGNVVKAIDLWQVALGIYRQWNDGVAEGQTYERIGKAYERLGQYQAAEDALRRHLAFARDNQDAQAQIFGFNNVGRLLLRQGHLAAAEQSFQQGLKLAKDIRFPQGEGLSWSNLGLVSYQAGRYAEALQRYQTAKQLQRYADADPVAEAENQNNLGDAFMAANNPFEAGIGYRQALFLAEDAGDRPNQFRALTGLMVSEEAQGRVSAALKYLNQRLTVATDQKDSLQTIKSLQLLAQFYYRRGDLLAADGYYQQAIALAKAVNAAPEVTALNNQLTRLRVVNQNLLR